MSEHSLSTLVSLSELTIAANVRTSTGLDNKSWPNWPSRSRNTASCNPS